VKLIVAVVQDHDAAPIIDALVAGEYRSTRINTQGGFLKRGNATILVGVEDDQVEEVTRIIRQTVRPGTASAGTGTLFVLPVARFIRV
jgi:uncharacterized protein YaaQ